MLNLIGIDVGTQSLRACVFRADGKLLAKELVAFHSTRYLAPSHVEQDPTEWWQAALVALEKVVRHPDVNPQEIAAISYACTSCTAVFLDQNDNPVRPALLWMDNRSVEEARLVQATNNPVLPYAGGEVSPEWMLPKILWVKKHEPETYKNAAHIVEQIDFFTKKLTGKWTLGYNHLVAKWSYANPVGGWPEGFIEDLGLEDVFPKWPETVMPMGEVVGNLDRAVAERIGLSEQVLVVQGGMDSTAGMVGLGAFDVGQIGISHGTSTVVQCQSDVFMEEINGRPDALVEGLYLMGGGERSTGAVAQWLVTQLAQNSNIPYEQYYQKLEEDVADIPPGSAGLVVLEHFQGSRKFHDPDTRGMFWGLTLWHKSAHLLRGTYEGISYGVRYFLEKLQNNGYEITRVSAGGGLMHSDISAQILADVCGLPFYRVTEREQTALGAAIVAGVGAGIFSDFNDGIAKMVRFSEPLLPNKDHKPTYDFYYDKYCRTYETMKPLMHEVVAFEKASN